MDHELYPYVSVEICSRIDLELLALFIFGGDFMVSLLFYLFKFLAGAFLIFVLVHHTMEVIVERIEEYEKR